jgi:uncharacterized SAM-binding protein YcdF (DUF218 family)
MITFYTLLIFGVAILVSFGMAWIFVLTAVALGGLLVYRTKRESHEALYQIKKPEGSAWVEDPYGEAGFDVVHAPYSYGDDNVTELPDPIKKATARMKKQMDDEIKAAHAAGREA